MLTDFYIPNLSNDIKIAVQKNHLRRKFYGVTFCTEAKNSVIIIIYNTPPPVKGRAINFVTGQDGRQFLKR